MKKSFLAAAIALALGHASAAVVTSDPYPAASNQPTSCSLDASGKSIACTLVPGPGGVTPTADLKSLPAGAYVIVLTVSTVPTTGCTYMGPATGWNCDGAGGAASSDPINVTLRAGAAPSKPVNLKVAQPIISLGGGQ